MKNTKIEWCDHTVNLWWGCTKISEACENCYAAALAHRFKKDCFGAGKERWDRREKALREIQGLNESARRRGVIETVFINSMSDFFEMPFEYRHKFYDVARESRYLRFLLLTKRPQMLCVSDHTLSYGPEFFGRFGNIHLGITAENQRRLDERMAVLKDFKPKVFISCEPMLEPLSIQAHADKIDWVICGGETGPGAREFDENWGFALARQCTDKSIPFFFKKIGDNPSYIKNYYSMQFRDRREFPAWYPKGEVA